MQEALVHMSVLLASCLSKAHYRSGHLCVTLLDIQWLVSTTSKPPCTFLLGFSHFSSAQRISKHLSHTFRRSYALTSLSGYILTPYQHNFTWEFKINEEEADVTLSTVVISHLKEQRKTGLEVTQENKYVLMSRHQNAWKNHNSKMVKWSFENVAKLRYLGTTVRYRNWNKLEAD
jgi:hypothetical protein